MFTGSPIIAKLQSLRYEGDCKNCNFDKYVNLHVEQHNQHADLQEYSVVPLAETLKTLWFQDSIKCSSLDAVKASINANRSNFTDFDSVKDSYVEFKCTLGWTNNPKTRSAMVNTEAAVAHASLAMGKDIRPMITTRRV